MEPHDQKLERFLVSGYTEHEGQPGIHCFETSSDGNVLFQKRALSGIASPSFCTLDGNQLYAASETKTQGGLAHCTIDDKVSALVDQIEFGPASGTCFVLKHPRAQRLYSANYDSGSVASCTLSNKGALERPVTIIQHRGQGAPREEADPHFDRQTAPHVHTLSFVPGTTLLAVVDLGLDLIAIYKTDAAGNIVDADGNPVLNIWPCSLGFPKSESNSLFYRSRATSIETAYFELSDSSAHRLYCLERAIPNERAKAVAKLPLRPAAIVEVPLFTGPRIIAYHPSGNYAALVCELACELIVFRLEADGLIWNPIHCWDLLQDAPVLIAGSIPPLAAHCEFSDDGRFLYASVRGTDQIITFELDQRCDLKAMHACSSNGGTPRHFAMSPDQKLMAVANQTGNNVSLFRRNTSTGALEATATAACLAPSCIIWKQQRYAPRCSR